MVDLSKVPFGEEKLFTQALEQGKGKLVLLIARNPCSGVSISDLCSPMLEDQKEKQDIEARYVSAPYSPISPLRLHFTHIQSINIWFSFQP